MTGWKLDTGLNSKKTFTIPNLTLQPRQIVAFFGTQTGLSLSDGGATVRLLKSSGQIVDAYTYPAVELPDRTYCRLPDGTDIWGFVCHPTPGRPNMSIISAVPGSTPAAGGNSNCPQASSAPPSLVMAECNGFGSGISNNLEDGLYWLQTRLKWDVFIE